MPNYLKTKQIEEYLAKITALEDELKVLTERVLTLEEQAVKQKSKRKKCVKILDDIKSK